MLVFMIGFTMVGFVDERPSKAERIVTEQVGATVRGELGTGAAIALPDGTQVTTLLESPDPGIYEVGVLVEGADELECGDWLVRIGSERFPAEECPFDSGRWSFTINATSSTGDPLVLQWVVDGQVKLELRS